MTHRRFGSLERSHNSSCSARKFKLNGIKSPFHGGESGSIPLASANNFKDLALSPGLVCSRCPECGPYSGLASAR